jgi:hypothetical protein
MFPVERGVGTRTACLFGVILRIEPKPEKKFLPLELLAQTMYLRAKTTLAIRKLDDELRPKVGDGMKG